MSLQDGIIIRSMFFLIFLNYFILPFHCCIEMSLTTHLTIALFSLDCFKTVVDSKLKFTVKNNCIIRKSCAVICTRKNLTSLKTSRLQVVFALLVISCQQVCKKLLTTYNNPVDITRLVTRLFQQASSSYN